jgi:hypothetical protein
VNHSDTSTFPSRRTAIVRALRFRMEGTPLVDNPDAVEADLERIVVAKARQLHERIQHFHEGRYAFGRLTTSDVRSIIPLVVTSEPIPMWTTTNRTIRAALKQEGLLQQSGVEPLHVVGVDELEMLEALVHIGIEAIDVLRAHANEPELKNVSLRNFVALRYEDVTSERLQAEYLTLGNHGASLLFNTHLGLHQQCLRSRHRGSIVSPKAQAAAHQGRERALAMTGPSGRCSRGGARRHPTISTGAALDRRQAPGDFPSTSQEAKV